MQSAKQASWSRIDNLPGTFAELRDQYFLFHLDRNPVTSTYVGGDGYSPLLGTTNTRLRDFRQSSVDAEVKHYRDLRASIDRIPPASLTVRERGDQQLMAAQLGFLIHQQAEVKQYQRAIDTYVAEPFRGVDWQIQQMAELHGGMLGTEADWQQVLGNCQ